MVIIVLLMIMMMMIKASEHQICSCNDDDVDDESDGNYDVIGISTSYIISFVKLLMLMVKMMNGQSGTDSIDDI